MLCVHKRTGKVLLICEAWRELIEQMCDISAKFSLLIKHELALELSKYLRFCFFRFIRHIAHYQADLILESNIYSTSTACLRFFQLISAVCLRFSI